MAVAGSTAVVNFTRCFTAHLVVFGEMKHQGASDSRQFIHVSVSESTICHCLHMFDLYLIFLCSLLVWHILYNYISSQRILIAESWLNLSNDVFETLPCAYLSLVFS